MNIWVFDFLRVSRTLKYPPPEAAPLCPAPRHWSANTDEPRPSTVKRGSPALEAPGALHAKGCRILLRDADCIACKFNSDSNTWTLSPLRILAMNFSPRCQTYFMPRPLAAHLKLQKSLYLSFESVSLTNILQVLARDETSNQAEISPDHMCKSEFALFSQAIPYLQGRRRRASPLFISLVVSSAQSI